MTIVAKPTSITEIMGNLEMEDLVAAKDISYFSKLAHSLTSIRDKLNEGSADIVSNRSVKQLSMVMLSALHTQVTGENPRWCFILEALVESLRVSPVQQVATELAQELKEYCFGLNTSLCEHQDLQLSMDTFQQNPPPKWTKFCLYMFKGKTM